MDVVNVPDVRPGSPASAGSKTPAPVVDLNELLGGVLRRLCTPEIVVRHDSLPLLPGSSSQLEQAFNMLVAGIVAHRPEGRLHFLYFKCSDAGQARTADNISVFSNVSDPATLIIWLQSQYPLLPALFEANGLVLECCSDAPDDCLFLLTLAGKPDS